MGKEKPSTKTCKYCRTEIPYVAKVCPQCRKKQKGKGGIIIAAVIVLGIVGAAAGGGSDDSTKSPAGGATEAAAAVATTEATTAAIEYTAYSVDDMMKDLKDNALKASEKYSDQYVEITGELSVIDSSGKYISLNPINDDFAIVGVQCYIKNDEQKSKVMEISKGDTVTLKGKITKVGEVLGYSLDITEMN